MGIKNPSSVAHPWHGVEQSKSFPNEVVVFVEVVPTDVMKYEIDKDSGLLKIDRPQRFSNYCPAPYGFLPKTYSGDKVASFSKEATKGDSDPLDFCVITERPIVHGNILLRAKPIGGIRIIDKGEADDKLLGILNGDGAYHGVSSINDLPSSILDRLKHYFMTYKLAPGEDNNPVRIEEIYGEKEATSIIRASVEDYHNFIS